MNAQENILLIRKVYEAFGRGDIQTILNNLTDDVDWISEGPSTVAYYGRMAGPEQVRQRFFDGLTGTQENMKLTMDEFVAQGDKVATLGRYKATVKATGKQFDTPVAHMFTIRDGKIARLVNLNDTAAVAEAYAGASAAAAG
ncbi:MAG: nuclear transport factor 2 family protein [Acidobacteriaceae bacterium]|nr:nuclear transport factor 2 family protein [Acidobacteriaceae bacterium]